VNFVKNTLLRAKNILPGNNTILLANIKPCVSAPIKLIENKTNKQIECNKRIRVV
jgi:hypothetical protein